jgi:hypothetical protein
VHPRNRRSRALWVAGTCILATVVATTAMTAAGAATVKAGPIEARDTVALTSGHTDIRNALAVVAGDAQWGVYEQLGDTDADVDNLGSIPDRLYSRDAHGGSRQLPFSITDQNLQGTGTWTLVDNMLTLSFGQDRRVRWWDLAAGAYGESGEPEGYVFGSSPDGWLLMVDGHVVDQPADGGASTVLGTPPGVDTYQPAFTTVGDDGYALAGSAGLLYSPWGATSTYTPLAVAAGDTIYSCSAEAYHAIACGVFKTPRDRGYVVRLPTSGAAAVTSTLILPSDSAVSLAVSAHATAWAAETQDAVRLSTVSVHGGPATISAYSLVQVFRSPLGFGPVGALGSFLVATGTPRTRSVGLVTSAGVTPTRIALGTPAGVHIATTVLAPNRVVYADDKHSTGYLDIYQRPLSSKHSLTVGRARAVFRMKSGVMESLAASDSAIAVLTSPPHGPDLVLRVFTSTRRTEVHIPPPSGPIAVSGHDVVYEDGRAIKELNGLTGQTRTLPFETEHAFVTVDGEVAYIKAPKTSTTLQVWSYPLDGGKSHRLFSVPSRNTMDNIALVGGHDQVALEYTTGGDPDNNNAGATAKVRFRAVNRSHAPHAVFASIPALCSPVALTANTIVCNVHGKVVDVGLRSYESRTVFAPSDAATDGIGELLALSVSGKRVAWATASGAGRIGLLPDR